MLFDTSFDLHTSWTTHSITASWPNDIADDDIEIEVILMGIDGNYINYDWIQLIEGNTTLNFDASDPIHYEHDLAIYKPRTDIIVQSASNHLHEFMVH